MKLRLEIEIEFEDQEDPSAPLDEHRQALDANLLNLARHGYREGFYTRGFPDMSVVKLEAQVLRLGC